MKSFAAMLACLALAAVARGYTDTGECPQVVHMEEFDLQRYSGLWYTIQKMQNTLDESDQKHCLQIAYIMYSESIVVIYELFDWNPSGDNSIVYSPYNTTAVPGELASVSGLRSVYILDTDYDTYASYYTCWVDGEKRYQDAAIISRTTELDPATVESQMKILEASNVDTSLLIPVLHGSYCPCFNITTSPPTI